MDSHEQVLLQALASAMRLTHSTEIEPDRVNELAALLHLPLTEVPQLVDRLEKANLVKLQWGGRVALTPEGQAHAEGRTLPSGPGAVQMRDVHLGKKAQLVINSSHTVTGPGAMGPGAMRVEMIDSLGDLTAALQALRRAQEGLSPEAKATVQHLEAEVTAIAHKVQQPQPDKEGLAGRLEQAISLIERLTSFTDAAQRLGPVLTLLRRIFKTLRPWVMGE